LSGLTIRQTSAAIVSIDEATVDVDAGTRWDELVGWAVARNLAGIECLSGIPGDVGAAPMQNIGAYGQEVSESLVHVEGIDRRTGELSTMTRAECRLAYRDSIFKGELADRYIIRRVRFRFTPGGA